jgi:hypothetical protein
MKSFTFVYAISHGDDVGRVTCTGIDALLREIDRVEEGGFSFFPKDYFGNLQQWAETAELGDLFEVSDRIWVFCTSGRETTV